MSPVNSMFVCIKKKKKKKKKISANLFLKWPISIIGKMLNIGADNRSTPNLPYKHSFYVQYLTATPDCLPQIKYCISIYTTGPKFGVSKICFCL